MNILFVYPNVVKIKTPQLGICMLAAIAKGLGHDCELYDLTVIPEGNEISAFRTKYEEYRPDVIAVSCRSNEWSYVRELFNSVDTGNCLKIFGGPHVTVAPEEVLDIADIVVLGEGEETFSELLTHIAEGKDISQVIGCGVIKDGNTIINELRPLITDLDTLPLPCWDIFDDDHYKHSYINVLFKGAKVIGAFEFSRGCPYDCPYCLNEYLKKEYKDKGTWRREKSPERIVNEIRVFRDQYGLDSLYWIDEVMLMKQDHLEKLRDLYCSEICVPFVYLERPENMTDERVRLMKEMGAQRVSIGIESGDDRIRRQILNRNHSQETIISAFQTAKKYGLITHAFTIIGFPGEDDQSIEETYKLLELAQPDTVQTTIFYPLRKTSLFEKVVSEGLFHPDASMPQDYYGESQLNYPASKKKKLYRYQYLLTYYKSRFVRILARSNISDALFRIMMLPINVYRLFHVEGTKKSLVVAGKSLRSLFHRVTRYTTRSVDI